MLFENVENALEYLISKKVAQLSNLEKLRLKDAANYLIQFSKENGVPCETIKNLTRLIIFEDCYDVTTRRKILYSCVPQTGDFPYEVIPLAISCATLPNTSTTWQHSILTWLSGLIEYGVIDYSNEYIHICYASIFNLLDSNKVCPLACRILQVITRLEDVTPHRTKILLRLEKKSGMVTCISSIIRIYKFFRPDLIISRLDRISRNQNFPSLLAESLKNAQQRIEKTSSHLGDSQGLWHRVEKKRRLNPFHNENAIPEAEILIYNEKIEQKKEQKISVLQFRRISSMIRDMPHWKDWIWPNNVAALLSKPALVFLFKPHDPLVKICLSNWLEIALRSEIIEGHGRKIRQGNLLDTCIKLLKESETIIPTVFHFLVEFLITWDHYSHFAKVIELISFFPFISPSFFFQSVFEKLSHTLGTSPLPELCSVIDAFGNMAATWLLQAKQEKNYYRKASDWPFDIRVTSPLEGVFYLCRRLERVILNAILRLGPHTVLLNTTISFYRKVNMFSEKLQLPMLIVPPAEFFFLVYSSGDIVATHRIGLMLVRFKEMIQFLKTYQCEGDEDVMRKIVLGQINLINFVLLTYLDSMVSSSAYTERWSNELSPYVGESFYKELSSRPNIRHCNNICRALPYISLFGDKFQNNKNFIEDGVKRSGVVNEILLLLKFKNLDGVMRCAKSYCS